METIPVGILIISNRVIHEKSDDRNTVDLLVCHGWRKTEAYLGLIAFTIFYIDRNQTLMNKV